MASNERQLPEVKRLPTIRKLRVSQRAGIEQQRENEDLPTRVAKPSPDKRKDK